MVRLAACLAVLFLAGGCAYKQKKIAPKVTYRAAYFASSDGVNFHPMLKLLEQAQKAKPHCRGIDRRTQLKAHYFVERRDTGIEILIKDCESSQDNCKKLEQCLDLRPVAWLSRAGGSRPTHAGTIYTDWLGRCGGQVAVNFYYGPQAEFPVEKVGCREPAHDAVDTAYDMYLVPRIDTLEIPPAGPYIELLLDRWNKVVFHELDAVPPTN